MPNWELISTPPSSLDEFATCIADAQLQYFCGTVDLNVFYSLINLYFELAWLDANPNHSGRAL